MRDIIVEIMVEVLTILGIATKEVKRGRLSELMRTILPFLTDTLFRKGFQEADGKHRHRGKSGEIGQVDARRGTDGGCRATEDGA